MTTTSRKSQGLSSTLKNLTINPSRSKPANPPTPDSWEESAASPSSSTSSTPTTPQQPTPGPPPPTPSSPTHFRKKSTDWDTSFTTANQHPYTATADDAIRTGTGKGEGGEKRPEKSNAAAGRMIAGALGVKVKKTEEGVRYERAVREKERKRREREREEGVGREREREEARRAVWEG